MTPIRRSIPALLTTLLLAITAVGVFAQQSAPGTVAQVQSLRAYWHVFIAYAIAILMITVWAGSIAKRLADVERRLGE